MQDKAHYIQVILPLHLEFLPWYSVEEPLETGRRVLVNIGSKDYIGVVSENSDKPKVDRSRIRPVIAVENGLGNILPTEIEFWKFISEYYLCTIGDVYKMVYPSGEIDTERKTRINKKLTLRSSENPLPALSLEFTDKPLLILGRERKPVYEQYVKNCLDKGKDVLFLHPDWPRESYSTQRELAKSVKSGTPVLIEGSKACLFLPFTKLGLIIVDEEHSVSYKHNASPRYNGRDAAIMLANIHKAAVILGSATPSLETLYNVKTGRFDLKELPLKGGKDAYVIDTSCEARKNGMVGEYSRKLLSIRDEVVGKGGKYLEIESWELRKTLSKKIERYDLVALMHTEYLLSRDDFRADEKAWQMLEELKYRCRGTLVIQTKNAAHSVFTGEITPEKWLEERRMLKLPPFTRLVEIRSKTGERQVLSRHFLARDNNLKKKKLELLSNAGKGCTIDVDPL